MGESVENGGKWLYTLARDVTQSAETLHFYQKDQGARNKVIAFEPCQNVTDRCHTGQQPSSFKPSIS